MTDLSSYFLSTKNIFYKIKVLQKIANAELQLQQTYNFKKALRSLYCIENIHQLNDERFDAFPILKNLLTMIFTDSLSLPELSCAGGMHASFPQINTKYGYFDDNIAAHEQLFNELAPRCRIITQVIENQAYDEEMPYKLMVICPGSTLKDIARLFLNIIKNQDQAIAHPYHDAFVTILHNFPPNSVIHNLPSWQKFIAKNGFKSLQYFADFASLREGFIDMRAAKEAILTRTYPRASENPKLALICQEMRLSNHYFEAGLAYVQCGWPKKTSDNLPEIQLQHEEYTWVKLPPEDLRALYLGHPTNCCQLINGHSAQCVKDGIELTDNGFYVLLKSKKQAPPIIDNELNTKDFKIVAQSYAWLSNNGNLCLDSIEFNKTIIADENIVVLLRLFANKILADYDIKHVTIGRGGQTPQHSFELCTINESMTQGAMYRDSKQQFRINSKINPDLYHELSGKLVTNYPKNFKEAILYLAPYFDSPLELPEALIAVNSDIVTRLPKKLREINLPSKLQPHDFKKWTINDPECSTVCKIFNINTEEDLLLCLPSMPRRDIACISLIDSSLSLPTIANIVNCLPDNEYNRVVMQQDANKRTIFHHAIKIPTLLITLLLRLPDENSRFQALIKRDIHGATVLHQSINCLELFQALWSYVPAKKRQATTMLKDFDGNNLLHKAANNYLLISCILESFTNKTEREQIVMSKNLIGNTVLHLSVFQPEAISYIMQSIDYDTFIDIIKEKNVLGKNVLHNACDYPESLQLLVYSFGNRQLLANLILELDGNNETLVHQAIYNPTSLGIILNYLDRATVFKIITEQVDDGKNALHFAAEVPESLHLLLAYFPDRESVCNYITKQDNDHETVLHIAAANHESLQLLLSCFPDNVVRCQAVILKNDYMQTTLHKAIHNSLALSLLIDIFEDSRTLSALLTKKHPGCESILYTALNYHDSFKLVVNCLDKDSLIKAILQKDCFETTILQIAAKKDELIAIIKRLDLKERLQVIILQNALLENEWHPRIFQALLKYLPPEINDAYKSLENNTLAINHTLSLIIYMFNMLGLADKELHKFLQALTKRKNISSAYEQFAAKVNASKQIHSFFSSDNFDIGESLPEFWRSRLETEHSAQASFSSCLNMF